MFQILSSCTFTAIIDWIIENYEVLSYAKVYAALAYYYDHIGNIEAEINQPEIIPPSAIDSTQHLADIRARPQHPDTDG